MTSSLKAGVAIRQTILRTQLRRRIRSQRQSRRGARKFAHVGIGEHGCATARQVRPLRQVKALHRGVVFEMDATHGGCGEQRVPTGAAGNTPILVDVQFRRRGRPHEYHVATARADLRDRFASDRLRASDQVRGGRRALLVTLAGQPDFARMLAQPRIVLDSRSQPFLPIIATGADFPHVVTRCRRLRAIPDRAGARGC